MNWKDYIKAIQKSGIVGGSLVSITANLFSIAGCVIEPSMETVKSWIYGKRKCKSDTYFPNGTIKTADVFRHFKNKPSDKLYTLQQIFMDQRIPASISPINVETTDLDIFCWSLVNQLLDLLNFDRVDVPQLKSDTPNMRKVLSPHDRKCCLYCVHWNGNKNVSDSYAADGLCCTRNGNRNRLLQRRSSTPACANYETDQALIINMTEGGYDVKDFI